MKNSGKFGIIGIYLALFILTCIFISQIQYHNLGLILFRCSPTSAVFFYQLTFASIAVLIALFIKRKRFVLYFIVAQIFITIIFAFNTSSHPILVRFDYAKNHILNLGEEIVKFKEENGVYPNSIDQEFQNIIDPWGQKYIYESSIHGFKISSTGSDGIEGIDDIICEAEEDSGLETYIIGSCPCQIR